MDLGTLAALFPVATQIIERAPHTRSWMEKKAKKEDPAFLLQLQVLETIGELRSSISELRSYTLSTAIMSAKLSNPNLTNEQVKQQFLSSAELAKDINATIKHISP